MVSSLRTSEWGLSRHRNTPAGTVGGVAGASLVAAAAAAGPWGRECLPVLGYLPWLSWPGRAGAARRPGPDGFAACLQDIGMAWPARSGDVEGAPGYYRCHHRGPVPGGGGPGLRGVPGLGVPPGGPLPRRGRGGVRAAVAAAEVLTA